MGNCELEQLLIQLANGDLAEGADIYDHPCSVALREINKLREAARVYSNNAGHTAKCSFWMKVQQQVSGTLCICGLDALAALIKESES